MRWPVVVIMSALAATTAACSGLGSASPRADFLAGTSWQLVAIQSMADAQGVAKIASPEKFTLELGNDGRASLRLDCNRGSGSWESLAAGDGVSGAFRFGAIATTRAYCPPPQLDQRIARDLSLVRGYLLKDGRLYLSLMADGGVYEWERRPH